MEHQNHGLNLRYFLQMNDLEHISFDKISRS